MDIKVLEEIGKLVDPMNKRLVLIKDVGSDNIGGIDIAGTSAQKKFQSGVVVKCSGDCSDKLSTGKRVGYQMYAGVDMRIVSGETEHDVVLLCEDDLTMILKGDTKIGVVSKN